jgi:hypothetical protein
MRRGFYTMRAESRRKAGYGCYRLYGPRFTKLVKALRQECAALEDGPPESAKPSTTARR